MFEKEADYIKARKESKDKITKVISVWSAREETIHDEGFQKGAEFGYNKANEWHYVKDGDLPKDMENVLINALDYGINTCYVAHRINGKWKSNCSSETFFHVIAWKEIVLPEEIK